MTSRSSKGPFRGQTGVVKQLLPARERVKVLLEVLGGTTEVDLRLTAVFKEAPLLTLDRPRRGPTARRRAHKIMNRSAHTGGSPEGLAGEIGERPRAAACLNSRENRNRPTAKI